MDLDEIVMKLVGPVRARGETNADKECLENMKKLTDLVDKLLFEILDAVPNADRAEASMRAIGEHARKFIESVQKS